MRRSSVVVLIMSLLTTPVFDGVTFLGARSSAAQDELADPLYSQDQLDNLLAPIALYPDPLLAQVLLAATFVDQVDEAGRWVRANGPTDIDDQPWDVSVKAVAHYPAVLSMMADKLDWTTAIGQAYVNQSTDVMASVQRLRAMAKEQGQLVTTDEQEVLTDDGYVQIVPADPRYLYVPTYDPGVVFVQSVGVYGPAIVFGTGFLIGAWLNHDCDWHNHRVFYTGWQGPGWIARSRPYVRITNVYVNTGYTTVTVNRTVVHRTVNYPAINRYHSVHRNVTYNNLIRNRAFSPSPPPVTHRIINRNINTSDPRLDRYRGRDVRPKQEPERPPSPPVAQRPASPPRAGFEPQRAPRAPGRDEGGFDARVSGERGRASRAEAAHGQPSAPSRSKGSRPAPAPSGRIFDK